MDARLLAVLCAGLRGCADLRGCAYGSMKLFCIACSSARFALDGDSFCCCQLLLRRRIPAVDLPYAFVCFPPICRLTRRSTVCRLLHSRYGGAADRDRGSRCRRRSSAAGSHRDSTVCTRCDRRRCECLSSTMRHMDMAVRAVFSCAVCLSAGCLSVSFRSC